MFNHHRQNLSHHHHYLHHFYLHLQQKHRNQKLKSLYQHHLLYYHRILLIMVCFSRHRQIHPVTFRLHHLRFYMVHQIHLVYRHFIHIIIHQHHPYTVISIKINSLQHHHPPLILLHLIYRFLPNFILIHWQHLVFHLSVLLLHLYLNRHASLYVCVFDQILNYFVCVFFFFTL